MRSPDSVDPTYGSDKHGLIWGYRFAAESAPASITSEEVVPWLASAGQPVPGSFLWLHFSLSNTASERWLRHNLRLPDAFYETLREQISSTRVELEGGTLVAVIHDAMFDFTLDPESIATVNLCMTPQLLVTARLRPVRSVDRLRAVVRAGQVLRSPAALLAQLLRHQAEVLTDIARSSTTQIDRIEDQILANQIRASRRELGTFRRTHVRLQRLLAPEPTSLFRLLNQSPTWIEAADLQELRQAAEEFSSAIADSAALVERIRLLQEELGALLGEQTGRTLFVLTVVTVLALPINLIAGLFGMNVGGIPFANSNRGFLIVVAIVATITIVAAYLTLIRRRQ